jgi:hypothetical protein
VALLSQPARNAAKASRPGARVHLLSWGVGECGVCGGHLRVGMAGNSKHGTKKPLYLCEGRGCVGRDEARVDQFVGHVVVERLRRGDLADLLMMDDGVQAAALKRAEGIRGRLATAADDFADERITADQLHRITARLKPELEQAEAEARMYRVSPHLKVVLDMAGDRAEELWNEMATTQRYAVLGVLIERVRIMPVVRKGPGFDPTSIEIVWKNAPTGVVAA